jgi:hypothetical protein
VSVSSVAAPPRAVVPARSGLGFGSLYSGALAFWMLTRCIVLVHQGAWPWMNAFVVAAARGIVVGDWNEAVRPVLPAMLGVPLVLAGATEQQAVAGLYLVASLVQLGCFVVLIRTLYPAQLREQTLALLLFVLVPYNHSIHHYRDVPVVFAQCAVYLLCAAWLRAARGPSWTVSPLALGAIVLGVWSRMEVLAFVGILVILALLIYRGRVARLAALYAVAGIVGITTLFGVARLTGVDLGEQAHYQFHTFLDSTPDSWLTPECRAAPTENCREHDGLLYFGPAEPQDGVWPMVFSHPVLTLAKTARSAFDNVVMVFGPNLSTYPAYVPLLLLALLLSRSAREALLREVPRPVWLIAIAGLAETVLPPLSWAPPHPQYHLQTFLAVVIVGVPVLSALLRIDRARWTVGAFFVANAVLSAIRYTRYAGP